MFGIEAGVAGLVSRRQMKREHGYQQHFADQAMDFEAEQAEINRQFQATQAATQHQRATADLEAAGLNRILALGQPAPSSAGAMAHGHKGSGTTSANAAQAMTSAASAAGTIKEQQARIGLLNEQQRQTSAEADKAEITRLPYTWANELMGDDEYSARGVIKKTKDLRDRIGQIWKDQKELMGARSESLKQRAHIESKRRESQQRGKAPVTTIHLTKPQGN